MIEFGTLTYLREDLNGPMDLRHLRYFVAVSEELHFGRAAARLNISQPPLSQQIRQLEDELGFPLFFRNKHHVELTEAGKVFLEETRLTLAHVEQARDAAEKANQGATGRLSIGFIGSSTYNIVPLLQNFNKRFPMVNLALQQMKTGRQLRALHERQIHLGIVRTPIDSPVLASETILREPFVVALPETHPLSKRETLSIQELADEPFILSSGHHGSTYHDAVMKLCYHAGFPPKVALEVPEILTIVAFVAEGMGIALVPASFRHQQNKGIVYRDLLDAEATLATTFVWRKDDKSPVLQQFLKLCQPLRKTYFSKFDHNSPS